MTLLTGREFLPKTPIEILDEPTEKDARLEIYNRRWMEHKEQVDNGEFCPTCRALAAEATKEKAQL